MTEGDDEGSYNQKAYREDLASGGNLNKISGRHKTSASYGMGDYTNHRIGASTESTEEESSALANEFIRRDIFWNGWGTRLGHLVQNGWTLSEKPPEGCTESLEVDGNRRIYMMREGNVWGRICVTSAHGEPNLKVDRFGPEGKRSEKADEDASLGQQLSQLLEDVSYTADFTNAEIDKFYTLILRLQQKRPKAAPEALPTADVVKLNEWMA